MSDESERHPKPQKALRITLTIPINLRRITNGERVMWQTGPDECEVEIVDGADDAVLRLWELMRISDHAERACRAALAMAAEVERLQAKWLAEGKEPFRIGIGINTGRMVVGNLGSEQLFDYTVIGDEVNLGARLESLNKEYKAARSIIISERTWEAARDAIEVRRLGEVTVKGKTRPVVVYELLGLKAAAG